MMRGEPHPKLECGLDGGGAQYAPLMGVAYKAKSCIKKFEHVFDTKLLILFISCRYCVSLSTSKTIYMYAVCKAGVMISESR